MGVIGKLIGGPGAVTALGEAAKGVAEVFVPSATKRMEYSAEAQMAALRQLVTGAIAEKLVMRAAATQVPQLERDIAALDGREFGTHSVGDRSKRHPAA